jgi:hypothetical protein
MAIRMLVQPDELVIFIIELVVVFVEVFDFIGIDRFFEGDDVGGGLHQFCGFVNAALVYTAHGHGLLHDGEDAENGSGIAAPGTVICFIHDDFLPIGSIFMDSVLQALSGAFAVSAGVGTPVFPALEAAVAVRLEACREGCGCPFEGLEFLVQANEQPQCDRDREADLSDHLCQFHVVSRHS